MAASTSPPPALLRSLSALDAADHPLYRIEGRKPGAIERVVGYVRYAMIVAYVLAAWVSYRWHRLGRIAAGPAPYVDELREKGIVQRSFSPEARSAIARAARPWFDELEARRAAIPAGERGYSDGQRDTTRDEAPELYSAIEKALETEGVLGTVRGYLGSGAKVRKVTAQMNDEWEGYWRDHFLKRGLAIPDTAFFHVDNTYGVVKVMMYLSEVDESSGPFSYVPGTNRIEMTFFEGLLLRATDIWIDVWPQNRRLLPTLPKSFRRKAKFGDDIPSGSDLARWLLEQEQVYTSAAGDLLLFDVMGIHRGGMIRRGERRILQIMIQ